jgi:hypothetical protein
MRQKITLLAISLFFGIGLNAQTYSEWGLSDNGYEYDTITQYNDILTFTFTGIPAGAWGDATLTAYFQGDFGSTSEYFTAYEQGTSTNLGLLAEVGFNDCAPEASDQLTFASSDLMMWQSGGTLVIELHTSGSVGYSCYPDRAKLNLSFNYCPFGTPAAIADFLVDTNTVCPHKDITLTGVPSGGTFSGTNVTGNTFDASGLTQGNYDITYTYTDAIGCITSATKPVHVLSALPDTSYLVCENGDSPVLGSASSNFYIYSDDIENTMVFDTASNYMYGPVTQSPTVFYQTSFAPNGHFVVDTGYATGSLVVDHDGLTGDDRAGIAVSNTHVYVVGDDNTARYDLNLQNGIILPIRDGLFSDLQTGQLWSLYNTVTGQMPDGNSSFTTDALMKLDAMLVPTGEYIMLSQPVDMADGSNNNGILAGYGIVGLSSGDNDDVYVVNVHTGVVTDLGTHPLNYYWGENWADWGVIGYDGVDYYAYYRNSGGNNIVKHNLTTDVVTQITDFFDISDLCTFTFSITTNRIYFHYEDGAQFGGNEETLGYFDADFTLTDLPGGVVNGCPSEIELTFNTVDLGPDTTICANETPLVLEAGFGYSSYTWNGDNNNWNIFPVTTSGPVILEVIDASNCLLTDTIEVLIDPCAGVGELENEQLVLYPNPNNGSFTIQFNGETVDAVVTIIDMMGKTVYREKLANNLNDATISADNLDAGMYVVNITTNDKLYQSTMVVK